MLIFSELERKRMLLWSAPILFLDTPTNVFDLCSLHSAFWVAVFLLYAKIKHLEPRTPAYMQKFLLHKAYNKYLTTHTCMKVIEWNKWC